MDYGGFKRHVHDAAERFRRLDGQIRLISHLDCDGMASAAIMIRAFNQAGKGYALSVVQQLNRKITHELSIDRAPTIVFADLGSGQLAAINEELQGKQVIVLDHHEPADVKPAPHVLHVNPHDFGIDGSTEISGSGVCYLFAKALSEKNSALAHLAVIGAIGDVQEHNGFLSLNGEILQEAIAQKKIVVQRGLRFFGRQTRPVHKLLEYSTNPFIPDVSGSESGAIQFLQQIGIDPRLGKGWKRLAHLNAEEQRRLIEGIVLKRAGLEHPEDVLGNIYLLQDEDEDTPFRDGREFSTLLNACGRLNKASIGISACLGDEKAKQKAVANLTSYRREIVGAMKWFRAHKETRHVIKGDSYLIINAEDNILGTIAGTMASILSNSSEFKPGTLILSMAQLMDNTTKVSLRIAGRNGSDLRQVINQITAAAGGESGGHMNAAGAIIPTDMEAQFLEKAQEILEKVSVEELVR
ncbi:MAG: DHH family phosphoesterase [Nanoarchaeota archaeon]